MNTKLSYLYRDADNYKQHEDVVFVGKFSEGDIALIASKLHEGECFIPHDVGLTELQGRFDTGVDPTVDHPWHEIVPGDDIVETNEDPTTDVTWAEFVARWRALSGWQEFEASERLLAKV